MILRNASRLLGGGVGVVLLMGCGAGRADTVQGASGEAPLMAQSEQTVWGGEKLRVGWSNNTLQQTNLKGEARLLVQAGKYAEIEKRMAQYRSTNEEFLDGASKLAVFYTGLSDVRFNESDADWQKLKNQLQSWHKEHPESVTAQVALAMTYYHGAFLARSANYAYKVKPEQWELMGERLEQAEAALAASRSARDKCPGWYLAAQKIYFLSGMSRRQYALVSEAAVRYFPSMTDYHLLQARYLLDRWYGAPGDWQAYAAKVARSRPGEAGDILYARIVWLLIEMLGNGPVEELQTFDWPRTRRGFEALMKKSDPQSVSGPFAVAAWLQRDQTTLKRLFVEHIGDLADRAVWTDPVQFASARKWALEGKSEGGMQKDE